ncbi:hypothetical protein AAFF_G00210320 [Aldrovandia affinis]|uniref:Uncharacterized protein n=1 Tax=Aldrovandia affinis TaxID=143900 RepID=A0AAD7WUI1_9TELE|nr:hypothetical protein AAFF_G00210320 [Aldrovandia affinis]
MWPARHLAGWTGTLWLIIWNFNCHTSIVLQVFITVTIRTRLLIQQFLHDHLITANLMLVTASWVSSLIFARRFPNDATGVRLHMTSHITFNVRPVEPLTSKVQRSELALVSSLV